MVFVNDLELPPSNIYTLKANPENTSNYYPAFRLEIALSTVFNPTLVYLDGVNEVMPSARAVA